MLTPAWSKSNGTYRASSGSASAASSAKRDVTKNIPVPRGDAAAGQPAKQSLEESTRNVTPTRLISRGASGEYDSDARGKGRHQPRQRFGQILQVGVHDGDDIPPGDPQPCRDCLVLPDVVGHLDQDDVIVIPPALAEPFE